jgi:hypothetical protein
LASTLRIGDPNDAYEQEADRVADEVMSGGGAKWHWSITSTSMATGLQRKCSCGGSGGASGECEECSRKKEEGTLQRKSVGMGGPAYAPPIVHNVLNSPGQTLDQTTRNFFEPKFGRELSGITIYVDDRASESANALHAHAYTVGSSIVFAANRYQPETKEGRRLLAHELTHVVHQRPGMGKWVQREDTGEPEIVPAPRTGSVLDQAFDAADSKHWEQAAELANGLSPDHLRLYIQTLKDPALIDQLHIGAILNPRVGPNSAVAKATSDTHLSMHYTEELGKGHYQTAAEYLNGFSSDDIRKRLKNLKTSQLSSLHQGAVDNKSLGPESAAAKLTAEELNSRSTQRDAAAAATKPETKVTPQEAKSQQAEGEPGGSAVINRVARAIGDTLGRASPVPLPASAIAALAAAELGFLDQGYQRLVAQGDAWRIATRLLPLAVPPASVVAGGQFTLGFLEGVVSPVTGLYHLVVGVVEAAGEATQWLAALPERYPAIVREAGLLAAAFERVGQAATNFVAGLHDPEAARSFALALLAGAEALQAQMVAAAQRAGRRAADGAVNEFLTGDLNQIAQTVGMATGTVTIEVALLVFTDGIGNLITKIGEVARILRPLSRGAQAFAAVAGELGGAVTALEELVGLLLSRTVLRPLRPLLEAIEPLILRLRSFGRALIATGEEAAVRAAGGAAARAAASGERRVVEAAAADRAAAPPLPSRLAGDGGGAPRRPSAGATAEGGGAAFRYEYHPETPSPDVARGRGSGLRPEESARPVPAAPRPAPALGRGSDVEWAVSEATADTGTAGRSPAGPEEVGGTPRRPAVDDPGLAAPQRVRREPSLGGNAAAARARGLPSEVVDSGYVYTRRDLPDVVPETGFGGARPARGAPPLVEERARGVAGRQPTAAPDPADVQNAALAADLRLIEDHLATLNHGRPPGSRWTLDDFRVNRTQVAEGGTGPTRASLRTRPDVQFTIRDPEGGAQRFLIEYDRSPPTRALSHARGILERDPTAIVILKVVGFG